MIVKERLDGIKDECTIWITLTSDDNIFLGEINNILCSKNYKTELGFVKKFNHYFLNINEIDLLTESQKNYLIQVLSSRLKTVKSKVLSISCISDLDNFDFEIPIHVSEIAYELKLKIWLSYCG